jgi:hypothetical protein
MSAAGWGGKNRAPLSDEIGTDIPDARAVSAGYTQNNSGQHGCRESSWSAPSQLAGPVCAEIQSNSGLPYCLSYGIDWLTSLLCGQEDSASARSVHTYRVCREPQLP